MLIVAVLPSILFPSKPTARRTGGPVVRDTGRAPATPPPVPNPELPTARPSDRLSAETVWVTSPQYRFGFSTLGGRLVQTQLLEYKSFAPGDSGRPVQLVPADRPLLDQWLGLGADRFSLAGRSCPPRDRAVRR